MNLNDLSERERELLDVMLKDIATLRDGEDKEPTPLKSKKSPDLDLAKLVKYCKEIGFVVVEDQPKGGASEYVYFHAELAEEETDQLEIRRRLREVLQQSALKTRPERQGSKF